MHESDWIEIRELCARYNHAVDDGRYEEFAACFTPEGTFEVVGLGEFTGREAIAGLMANFGYGPVHLSTDAVVTFEDGDTATQVCSLLLGRRTEDKSSFSFLTSGRYADRLVKTPGGWQFSHRRIETDRDIMAVVGELTPQPAEA